ncbi:SusC/RagA family TonB-linked outer membrane protein [Aquimarina sp. LLG6339-5]|uniref:SusC/RagA family TonB-linked outer membrane protein n=1 Tax=Aquimarina sp. LLG6339-5 TaxID=3160830 RepID=UPI00386CAF6C
MRTKFRGILTLLLAFVVQLTFAQEKTISGNVTDNSGLPLPGVNIVVKGTSKGTQSDFDGNYTIQVNRGAVLSFSYLGFTTKEVVVGDSDTISVQLTEDAATLEEVVVTAQGIKRERKSLGYAISTVASDDIQEQSSADLGRILSGEAAGLNITSTNGTAGSGTNIIIRGLSTISGSNQPLFIVDGVPFANNTNQQNAFFNNVTESSRFLDIDPNNIESVNVLKGLSASVLYGQEGRNGVILITTKTGSAKASNKKFEVTFSQSLFAEEAVLPDYQDEYGGGFHQNFGFFFSNWGPSFNRDISSNSLYRSGAPGNSFVANPLSQLADQTLVTGFEDIAASDYAYRPYDSVDQFFKTGFISNTSIGLSGGNENASFSANYSYFDQDSFTPGNQLTRNNIGFGGKAKLSNKLTFQGTANYTNSRLKTPPISASAGSGTIGNGSSVFGDILYTPRSVDLFGLPFQAQDGRSVYYRSGNDIQNPLWTIANAKVTQETDNIFGSASLTYGFNDNYSLTYRAGLNTFTEFNTNGQNKGGVDGDVTGFYRTIQVRNTVFDNSLILNGYEQLNENLGLTFIAGLNTRRNTYQQEGTLSTQQLAFGVLEHYNFVNQSTNDIDLGQLGFEFEDNTIGVYADVSLDYKSYLFFNGVIRNDWFSTLEQENNSIFYPGASISLIATDAIPGLQGDMFNYLKARVAYGESAGAPGAFSTRNTLGLNSRAFVDSQGNVISSNSVSNVLGNADLKPERFQEFEVGIETRFINNRVGLNVSLFKRTTEDLITNQALDPASGFTSKTVNLGQSENEGIEVDFDITPWKSENFKWLINGNFYADENVVTEIPTDQIALTASIGGRPANYAIAGEAFGILQGTAIQRDTDGNPIVGSDGLYLATTDIEIIGDPNPDWTGTIKNTFSYKGLKFSFDFQYRHGGDIFSQTASTLVGRGVVDSDNPIDRRGAYILPGVLQDGTTNNIPITATNVFFSNFGFGPNESQIYDGTTLRLNEVSLSYDFKKEFLSNTPFGSLSVTLLGSNLWYKAFNFPDDVNFDTNTLSTGVGNGQGIDFITGPSSRRYGLSFRATF